MSEKLRHDLNTVRADFDTWRQRRRSRERIPDALWAAAVGLLDHHPFGVVCRTLRLSPKAFSEKALMGSWPFVESGSRKTRFPAACLSFAIGPGPR